MSQQDMDQDWIGRLSRDGLRRRLYGALRELALVEDTLAGALGYPRSDGGPDDPNGGGYITGEHTAVSLAAQAGNTLASVEASRRDWAAEADRLTEVVRALSGELGEAGFEHAAVTVALATVQPDLEFDCDEPLLCSCLTAEGAAFVAAQPKWSLPVCAVHPEVGA